MHFLDIPLALMNEKELRGYFHSSFCCVVNARLLGILLYCQIPERYLIISARCSEDRVFSRVPLDRSNWLLVPSKMSNWCWVWITGTRKQDERDQF